jgi:Transcription factor WhiB
VTGHPWRDQAACQYWPDDDGWISSRAPEFGLVCQGCPVRPECAKFVLALEEACDRPTGWWGGHYLPQVGGDARDRQQRRESLTALRELVAGESGSAA